MTDSDATKANESLDLDAAPSDAWAMRPYPIQGEGQRNVVQIVVKRSVLAAIRCPRPRTDLDRGLWRARRRRLSRRAWAVSLR